MYTLGLTATLFSCRFKEHDHVHTIRKRVVYVQDHRETTAPAAPAKAPDTSYVALLLSRYDLVDIHSLDTSIRIDLKYAGSDNFLGYDLYDGLRTAYFTCDAALRICSAQYLLKQLDPDLSLLILDASRPHHIQQIMWDSLKIEPSRKPFYLSNPQEPSMHNYGCAVDVTILNTRTGELLDMGTGFDFFGKLSEPIYESRFLKTGELSETAYQNRLLLRTVMKQAGMNAITSEWWHFSLCSKAEAMAKYPLIR